jgi:hypothetical protein
MHQTWKIKAYLIKILLDISVKEKKFKKNRLFVSNNEIKEQWLANMHHNYIIHICGPIVIFGF